MHRRSSRRNPRTRLILAALAFDTGTGTLDLLIGRLGHAEQRADLLVGVHRAQGRRVGVHNDFTLVAFSNRLLARIVVVGDVQPAEHHGTVYDAPHADRNEPHHERGRLGLNKFAQGVGQSRKHDARKNERNARYKQPREKTLGALTIFHRVEILDEGVATLKLRMLKSSCYDKAETDGDCRIEKNFLHTLNDPFLLGYWGISHYSSTKASSAKELLEQLGYVGYSTYGWGSTGVADSLLGIRWLYSDGSRPVAGHWQPVDCDSAYTLYKNDAAFPLAYLARQDALSVDVDALADNTFTMQNAMLQSLTGCTDTALVSVEPTFSVTDKGTVQVDFTAPLTGPAYMAIPGTEEQLPIDVVVDGKLYAQYFEPESLGGVICLPSFTAGQHVTMVLGIADDEVFHTNTQIYQLDSAALAAARQQVQDVDADIREGGRIDVHCTVSGDNDLLALSFAYDDNWVVTVNGEEVQPSALFGGLLGVSLPQGDCTVTLRYTHPGVVPGGAASLAALAAALVWWFAERRRSQNA